MNKRGTMRVLGAALAAASLLSLAGTAEADVKCRATVAKESAKLTQAIAKILQKCEQSDYAKQTGACPDAKSAANITKAKGKLVAAINKACTTSTGEFTFGRCPNPDGGTGTAGPCSGILIQSKTDVGECLGCLAEENASELISAVMYGSAISPQADKGIAKCQATVGKLATAFYLTKSKALAKCQDAIIKGKATACPDAKASDAIAKAEAKKIAGVAKACGCGDDGVCGGATCTTGGAASGNPATGDTCEANRDCNRCIGGADDGSPCFTNAQCSASNCSTDGLCESPDVATEYKPLTDLGFPQLCPGIQVGSQAINFTGNTMQSVLKCVDTQADQRATCQDAAGATFNYTGSLPSGCSAAVATCTPTGGTTTKTVSVSFSGPAIGGVSISLGYVNVTLPGTGGTPSGRVTNLQSGLLEEGDRDDSAVVSVTDIGSGIVAGPLFTVEFDVCAGAPDFGCVVRSASTIEGNDILDGVTCSVM